MSAATDAFVKENQPRLLNELKAFVRIPSISTLPEHRPDHVADPRAGLPHPDYDEPLFAK